MALQMVLTFKIVVLNNKKKRWIDHTDEYILDNLLRGQKNILSSKNDC
jgi:hypothetical protein